MNPLELTYHQLVDQLRLRYGRGEYHAAALYRAFYSYKHMNLKDIPEFHRSANLAQAIARDLDLSLPKLADRVEAEGVTKLQLRLLDGLAVETVLIPMATHMNVCISSYY